MKSKRRYCFIIVIVSLLLALLLFLKSKSGSYQKNIMVADHRLIVEIANTSKEIEQGLSDKEKMCSDCGMLFVFDQKGIYPFWMRRMHFDIDILWLAENKVVDITYGAKKPSKEDFERPKEVFQSTVPVDKALEVNAGWVEKNGIKIGDKLNYED